MMITTKKRGSRALTGALLAGAAMTVLGAEASAQTVRNVPQVGAPDTARPIPGRRTNTNWSFDLRATYSDNFRRIDDERIRRVELVPTGGNPDTPIVFPVNQEITPPDNVIFTASVRGSTIYRRPGLTGIVQGGVAVTTNADNAPLDERLADEPLPEGLFDDFDGTVTPAGFGLTEDQELFIRPDIAASATARIVDQLVYVDVAAVAQQQVINQRQAVALEADGQLGDVTTFIGGSVSPYISRQFGGTGTLEARYRLSGVVVADEQFEPLDGLDANGNPLPDSADDQRFANDSVAQEAILEYASGDFLDRVEFTLRASAARSDEDGSDLLPEVELTRLTGEGTVAYDLGRSLALTGTLGYDDVTVDQFSRGETGDVPSTAFSESELSGVFWSIGAEYAPTRRSRFDLSVGERFDGTQVTGSISYQPTPRLSVAGTARRDLSTGTQDGLQGALGQNSRTLQIVEQLSQAQSGSAQQLLDRVVGFRSGFSNIRQQAFGVQVRDTFSLSASYAARRTDFGVNVSFTDAEFGEGDRLRENTSYTLQGSVRRQVTRRITAGASARYERIEGALPVEVIGDADVPDQTSEQVFLSADGAYALGPRFALTARAYRVVSEGNVAGFGIGREFEENAVSAGIRWTF